MRHILFWLFTLPFITSCGDDSDTAKSRYGVFLYQDDTTLVMNGTIGSSTPKDWDDYIKAYPDTKHIIMKDCPGSEDDTANLEAARKVHQRGVSIHLPSAAVIASGAVDFFLAGVKRTRDEGSMIGVHSWSDGSKDATAFPVGDPEHQPYIDYYKEVGFSEEDAKAFYYFTINAAPAAGIHYMTDAEIAQYKLLTQ